MPKLHVALSLTPEENAELKDKQNVLIIRDAKGVSHSLTRTTGAAVIDLEGSERISFTLPKPHKDD